MAHSPSICASCKQRLHPPSSDTVRIRPEWTPVSRTDKCACTNPEQFFGVFDWRPGDGVSQLAWQVPWELWQLLCTWRGQGLRGLTLVIVLCCHSPELHFKPFYFFTSSLMRSYFTLTLRWLEGTFSLFSVSTCHMDPALHEWPYLVQLKSFFSWVCYQEARISPQP